MKKIAKTISLILGFPWVIVIVLTLLYSTGLNSEQFRFFAVVFPVLHFVIPLVYIAWSMRRGTISDIDMTKRSERYGILTVVFLKNMASFSLIWLFGTTLLLKLATIILVVFTAVYVITFFWKISLHMTFNTMGIILVNVVSGWEHWYLFLLIPLVYWSRHILNKHTQSQLIGGFLVCGGIMMVMLKMFALI